MIYILGIITGIILCAFLLLIDLYLQRNVARGGVKQILSKLTQEQGAINIPASDEFLQWQDRLKKNDEAGVDTLLDDL